MSTPKYQKLTDLAVVLHNEATSLPTPTGTAGADVSAVWTRKLKAMFEVAFDPTGTADDGDITVTNGFLCYRPKGATVYRAAAILPSPFTLINSAGAKLGFATLVEALEGFDYLAVKATFSAAKKVTVTVTPVEIIE